LSYYPPYKEIIKNLPQRHGDTEENNKEKWGKKEKGRKIKLDTDKHRKIG